MEIIGYRTETAIGTAAEQLAAIRVEAMRPSLEAVGRFDPDRARERFLSSFDPKDTEIIYLNDRIVGFYVLREHSDHLYLDHLYIVPNSQGRGIGQRVIKALKRQAETCGLPIRLLALNGSPSNKFYRFCGFKFVSADTLDTIYEWRPPQSVSSG
ncbi:GNAT family N-acetyltransferase [Brucella pseudogrignonensis]|uniref:GNAT family N-acetyltransferase n=1 Tax=Brucella pseudogrignonensis TaxID=419475 RepID=UPI001E38ABD3|nr:GNAT family N-acetyltransferase [Brucella pseudogrignonensis]MCD4514322.1 GNAT family N-acetyltransferase [Brucella pseudogrignonensis]